jgi:hypothetical protein
MKDHFAFTVRVYITRRYSNLGEAVIIIRDLNKNKIRVN